jgi:hypothetical protein
VSLSISPTVSSVVPNGRKNFSATGGTPPYVFSISSNRSGGSIDSASGLYLAGPRGLVPDQVTVTDAVLSTSTALVNVSAGLYQSYQRGLVPPSLKFQNAQVIEGDFGGEKDVAFERARQGVRVNLPGIGAADALDTIAWERQLPRAAGESDAALAARLKVAWDDDHGWLPAGSHASILYALDRAGFPMGDPDGAHVMQRHVRYSWLTASGGTPVYGVHPIWTFDGSDPRIWNQFGIVFGADVVGLSTGSDSAKVLNGLVRLWKPEKARFMGTWIIVSGPTWGWPVGTKWGDMGLTWGGGVTRFVPPT